MKFNRIIFLAGLFSISVGCSISEFQKPLRTAAVAATALVVVPTIPALTIISADIVSEILTPEVIKAPEIKTKKQAVVAISKDISTHLLFAFLGYELIKLISSRILRKRREKKKNKDGN